MSGFETFTKLLREKKIWKIETYPFRNWFAVLVVLHYQQRLWEDLVYFSTTFLLNSNLCPCWMAWPYQLQTLKLNNLKLDNRFGENRKLVTQGVRHRIILKKNFRWVNDLWRGNRKGGQAIRLFATENLWVLGCQQSKIKPYRVKGVRRWQEVAPTFIILEISSCILTIRSTTSKTSGNHPRLSYPKATLQKDDRSPEWHLR